MTATVAATDLDRMLLIREFEEAVLGLFAAGEVSGTTHTCIGQEYIPVALQPLLAGDSVFSNHRSHGHYLARFGDPVPLLAEILGRAGAPCSGVGGSQHLFADGFMSTGVQGENVAVAAGMALHFQRARLPRIAAVYIGDGSWGEGVLYEVLNMAQLWRLPLLVLVENNGIAQSTPTSRQMAGSIAGRAAAFGVSHEHVRSLAVDEIREQLAPRIEAVRSDPAPLIVEFDTVRLGPHSKGDDTRTAEEIAAARRRDWLVPLETREPGRIAAARDRQRARVAAAVGEVLGRPLATWEALDGQA